MALFAQKKIVSLRSYFLPPSSIHFLSISKTNFRNCTKITRTYTKPCRKFKLFFKAFIFHEAIQTKFLFYCCTVAHCIRTSRHVYFEALTSKIQQTKMLVTCQRFGDWFLFGLVWPYSSNQKNIMKVGSKSFLLTCSSNKLWAYLHYIFLIRRES